MILKNLLKGIDFEVIKGNSEIEINNICYDNRKVSSGDVFVCIKGFVSDGHKYIDGAIKNGATSIIVEELVEIDAEVNVIKVKDSRKALAIMGANYYNNPANKLNIIGITGTNGKTTTAFMIKSILEQAGHKVGLIGTIANYIGNKPIKTERTTPESLELQKLFYDMVNEEVKYCVMEVSSHSLELDRVYGVQFESAIFTNLTRDHLDFHKTFENYYKAKFKLFERTCTKIINIDDEYGIRVLNDLKQQKASDIYTIATNKISDFTAKEIKTTEKGSEFKIVLNNVQSEFKVNIPGLYNVYNSLGAIISCYKMGISIEAIKSGLERSIVPGRCERVATDLNLPYEIIIDYAHSPDGLENIINTVRACTKNRVITVFGCGGDRDTVKRPIMGKIASDLSDIAIVTSDNPRSEEPIAIINDILKGIEKKNCEVIENRYMAIEHALDIAKNGDVILIAGKGHETYQILNTGTIHFDEREVVYEILNK
ncbi:UDP-N-acetylmuramoylalanyl-D-glutamate--2,6-diaminopimelate ligase [Clostridium cavendishii DSM 21758]|uniref:UDP-N-acetylmuramoyl-L-alanyl-D-glutamate--2,6-diaminopimelate ligase n=1 Tax=Clostridium cavendishii DSM 21758 TaxID=1121302 RepID=A0A1M6KQ28_9CLOT|nr:UDP-N-acetylmuramoyl-L-alanyl-D-glutamate--2,6-diaminopimelate ligase [Clostridium cavendishii]SHJ60974.1 UDP-N-acetylmuramoylalanyl-D-glutamate--2,6-diaminopimelate ligase [Clostridium cavendishii DSM 21758]